MMETEETQRSPQPTVFEAAVLRWHADQLAEQRRTRFWVSVIGWVALIWLAAAVIGGIYVVVQVSHNLNADGSSTVSSTCESAGGYDPAC